MVGVWLWESCLLSFLSEQFLQSWAHYHFTSSSHPLVYRCLLCMRRGKCLAVGIMLFRFISKAVSTWLGTLLFHHITAHFLQLLVVINKKWHLSGFGNLAFKVTFQGSFYRAGHIAVSIYHHYPSYTDGFIIAYLFDCR